MKVKLPVDLFNYFKNERKIAISVNKISEYLSIDKLCNLNISLNFQDKEMIEVDIDEDELDNNVLKNETIFVIIAMYAMAIGE